MQHNRKHNFNIFNVAALVCALLICSSHFVYANATEATQRSILSAVQSIYSILGPKSGYPYNIWDIDYRIWDNTSSIGQNVDFIMTDIDNMGAAIAQINAKTKDYTSYIDGVEAKLDDLKLTWNPITYTPAYYDNNGNSVPFQPWTGIGSDIYINVPDSSYLGYDGIVHLRIPVTYQSNLESIKVEFSIHRPNFNNELLTIQHFVVDSMYYTDIYFIPPFINSAFYIHLHSDQGLRFIEQNNYICEGISKNSSFYNDYLLLMYEYDILNHTHYQTHLIDRFAEVYASQDLIDAKENQQAYEDQAITDFTGSGSAAASGSDTTNMKNVSGAIKSGLDSGGSVNGALGVFNTSGGLWDWFSQSNYDEINGTQTRSRGSDEYIDFYNTNREELQRLLQEER